MARLYNSGFELNSITDGMEFDTNSAPVSIVTTNPRSGTYHGRVNAGAGFWRVIPFLSNQTTTGYIGVALLVHANVNASTQLVRFSNAANTSVGNITLTTSRTLVLLKSDGTQIGSASAALTLDTWYYIELKNNASTSPGALEGRLNGSVFATGANSNQGQWARALVGNVTGAQTTNDVYFDDWKINDSSGATQNAYPGDGKLAYVRPTGTGDVNSFNVPIGGTVGAANNFTRVNEVPPDDATSYNASNTANQEDLFAVGTSGVGASDTVNVVVVGARLANLVTIDNTTGVKLEIEKTSGGTIAQSAEIVPDTTAWETNNNTSLVAPYPLVLYNDPDGSPWTSTTLGTMQIGYKLTTAHLDAVAVSNVWAIVDYTPGASTNTVNVSDSTTTSESIKVVVESNINKSDPVTSSENVVLTEINNIAVSDSTTASESISLLVGSNASVSDSTTLSENTFLNIPTLFITVSDSTALSESTKLLTTSFITISDSSSTSENTQILSTSNIVVSDTATLTESVQLLVSVSINVSDNSTLSENILVQVAGVALQVSTADSALVSENVQLLVTSFIARSDATALSESVVSTITITISKSDSINLTESVQRLLQNFIRVSDSASLLENIALFINLYNLMVFDLASISENVDVHMPESFLDVEPLTLTVKGVPLKLIVPTSINISGRID